MSDEDHKAILGDVGHPMHQLFTTFSKLDLAPDKVTLWPVCDRPPAEVARTALMKQVFCQLSKPHGGGKLAETILKLQQKACPVCG